MTLSEWEGRKRWIEARIASLVRVAKMLPGEAAEKAKREFSYFMSADRRAGKEGE